jgi:hypothetical protein
MGMRQAGIVLLLLSALEGTSPGADGYGWCQFASRTSARAFDGTLHRGERFERDITRNLVFRLDPFDGGWNIVVAQPGKSENFAGIVHLPLRFDYTLEILGWHFGHTEGRPQPVREFTFVLSMEDYVRVDKERVVLLWPYSYSTAEVEKAQQFGARVRCGKGRLVLSDVKVTAADDPAAADIQELAFHAEFSVP